MKLSIAGRFIRITKSNPQYKCLMDKFIEDEKLNPLQKKTIHLYCPCEKCRSASLIFA